jgi:hypothetical protein
MSPDGAHVELSTEQPLQIEMAAHRLAAPAFDVQARA